MTTNRVEVNVSNTERSLVVDIIRTKTSEFRVNASTLRRKHVHFCGETFWKCPLYIMENLSSFSKAENQTSKVHAFFL